MRRAPIQTLRRQWRVPAATVGEMPSRRRTISPSTRVLELERIFLDDSTLTSVVVSAGESEDAVCVSRAWFFAQLTGRLGFGRAIYTRHPVSVMPRPETLVLPAGTTVLDAAQAALNRGEDHRYDDLVVRFEDGGYGTICVAELFAEVAHAQAYAALHDALTELPNRSLFLDRLERARAAAAAGEEALFAVLFVDVDEFKTINDALGHEAGDLALSSVADRLTGVGEGGGLRIVVARLGGDEFGVLVEGVADFAEVVGVVQQIVSALSEPLLVASCSPSTISAPGFRLSVVWRRCRSTCSSSTARSWRGSRAAPGGAWCGASSPWRARSRFSPSRRAWRRGTRWSSCRRRDVSARRAITSRGR